MECLTFAAQNSLFSPVTPRLQPLAPAFQRASSFRSFSFMFGDLKHLTAEAPNLQSGNSHQGDDCMDVDTPAVQFVISDAAQYHSDRLPFVVLDPVAGPLPKFTTPSAAGDHLSHARAALHQYRRLKKKRKSQEGLTEIRKQEQRASKRICNARTRRGNVYLQAGTHVDLEFAELQVLPEPSPSVQSSHISDEQAKPLHSSTNHDRVAAAKLARLEETKEVTQMGLRKRDFIARKTRMTESFTAD